MRIWRTFPQFDKKSKYIGNNSYGKKARSGETHKLAIKCSSRDKKKLRMDVYRFLEQNLQLMSEKVKTKRKEMIKNLIDQVDHVLNLD